MLHNKRHEGKVNPLSKIMKPFATIEPKTTEDGDEGFNITVKIGRKIGYGFYYKEEDAIRSAQNVVNDPDYYFGYFDTVSV